MPQINRRGCPKCGGTAGFQYRLVVVYDQWVEWDGITGVSAESENFDSRNREGKMGQCVDCGHRFKISRLLPTKEGGGDTQNAKVFNTENGPVLRTFGPDYSTKEGEE